MRDDKCIGFWAGTPAAVAGQWQLRQAPPNALVHALVSQDVRGLGQRGRRWTGVKGERGGVDVTERLAGMAEAATHNDAAMARGAA